MAHVAECRRFVAAIENLGATVPADLAELLAQFDAVKNWTPTPVADIASVIRSGQFSATKAAEHLDRALHVPTTDPRAVTADAYAALAAAFTKHLRGTGGDDVIEAVRPKFEAAAKAVTAAREWINPATTPAQVLEMGDKAAKAWRDLATHRQVLDAIHGQIIHPLAEDFGVVGDAQPQLFRFGLMPMIGAFYARDEDTPLEEVGRMLMAPGTGPGGKWLPIITVSTLELNTATRAREIIAEQAEQRRKAKQAEYDATHGTLDAPAR